MATNLTALLSWQQPLWLALCERRDHDRLPHALLLHGAAGIGKGQLARFLAASLLCQKPLQYSPCQECPSCRLFAAGTHPDFFLAHATYGESDVADESDEKKSRKTKKTAVSKQIKIDCIRDLIHFSTHAAHQGGRRVVMIEPVDALNHSAANALLKTMEEPGSDLFIILVAQQASLLLPTLRSRCQAVFCATPHFDEAQSWLCSYISAERAQAALLFCAGAPLRALQAVNDNDDIRYGEMLEILRASHEWGMNYVSAAEALEKLGVTKVVDWWLADVHQQCKKTPQKKWLQFADCLLIARKKIHGTSNPNVRLLLEALLIEWLVLI